MDDPFLHAVHDTLGREILTLGQLRALTKDLPDDTQVVLDDGDGWYLNVEAVAVPDDDRQRSDWSCVTLMRGSGFDSRQF